MSCSIPAALPSFSFVMMLCFCLAILLDTSHGFTTSMTFRQSSSMSSIQHPPLRSNYHSGRRISLAMSSSAEDGLILSAKAKELQEKAARLRNEIAALENQKSKVKEEERQVLQKQLDQQEAYMQHYSGIVPILKPDGSVVMERVQFPPLIEQLEDGEFASDIWVYEAYLPLGIILGQDTQGNPAVIVVDEVVKDSNGALAGIQVGDVLRACTSCRVEMEQPTWQLLVGGIGRPKTMRFMFGTDDQPLETVLQALGANRMDPESRPVVLVVERPRK